MKVTVCKALLEPQQKIVPSSGGDSMYRVITPTIFNDPICTCLGYHFRSTCKHVETAKAETCEWFEPFPSSHSKCPSCGGPITDFEMEPEE